MTQLVIDSQLYHLGDEKVAEWPPPLGTNWSKTFELRTDPGDTTLLIDVRGTKSKHNEIYVNGTRLWRPGGRRVTGVPTAEASQEL
jgi:hypothetical protein